MSALAKFRRYRAATAGDSDKPICIIEWWLGRMSGWLLLAAAKKAQARGDHAALNHALLATWAGNQSDGGHLVGLLPPPELSRALKEHRLRIVIDPTR